MQRVTSRNNTAWTAKRDVGSGLALRLFSGAVAQAVMAAALLGGSSVTTGASAQVAQPLAPNDTRVLPPDTNDQGRRIRAGRLNESLRRETHPPRAPESASQGQVTNANAAAPNAGIFPFIPPYFTKLPNAGLSVDTKGIGYATDDKDMQFRIGGRYQEDFSAASTSPRLRSTPTTPLIGADGIDARRAFIEAYLTLKSGVSAVFQYDFANPTQPIQDAAVGFQAPGTHVVYTLGNFKEPFSLGQLSSDNNTLFTERSLMDGLVPGRNFGGAVATYGDKWTAEGAVYAGNANNTLTDNGVSGTGRVTYAPILEKNQLLHFGVAGSYRSLDQLATTSFSSRPEDYLERALTTTGTIRNADALERVNGEALYQLNNMRIQGEYTFLNVTGLNGVGDRSFQGGYVEGGWVINGAGRPYRVNAPYGSEMAILQGVQVEDPQRISNGGIGVWELGLRYSAIDLNNRSSLAINRVSGGSEQDFTAGLNWYPDRNIRMMADYVHGWVSPASSIAEVSAVRREVQSDTFVGRMQVYW